MILLFLLAMFSVGLIAALSPNPVAAAVAGFALGFIFGADTPGGRLYSAVCIGIVTSMANECK